MAAKLDKLLVALRTRTHQLFELYIEDDEGMDDDDEDTLVESYKLTEEFILKDGRRVRITDCDNLQQIGLTEGAKRILVKRVTAGYVLEASDGNYTACRTLSDGANHLPLGEKERVVLSWALESIKWLVRNAQAIVGD